jgi:hypothetical protein
VQDNKLPFWVAYARAVLLFFLGLMALDWLAYLAWGNWLEWWGILALATVLPGMGLMITWDEM